MVTMLGQVVGKDGPVALLPFTVVIMMIFPLTVQVTVSDLMAAEVSDLRSTPIMDVLPLVVYWIVVVTLVEAFMLWIRLLETWITCASVPTGTTWYRYAMFAILMLPLDVVVTAFVMRALRLILLLGMSLCLEKLFLNWKLVGGAGSGFRLITLQLGISRLMSLGRVRLMLSLTMVMMIEVELAARV